MENSYKKGDLFEKQVFDLLKRLVENDEFFVPGKRSKVFRKQKYYSEKRKSDIVVDISIETYLDNATNYSFLTIIECKNVERKITVDDVEEFESKLSQIGEHNTKGIIATNNSFQESAYNLAVSQKIGLIRLVSNKEYEWINYRKLKFVAGLDRSEMVSAFVDDKLEGTNLIACLDGQPVYNISDVLVEIKVIDFYCHKESFIRFPFVKKERIECIIQRLRNHNIYEHKKLDMDKLCQVLAKSYQVEFDFNTHLPNNLLGKIEFDPLKISVTGVLKGEVDRWRFTLAHEVGHLILHSPHLRYSINEKTDTDTSLSLKYNVTDAVSRRLEYQANLFASNLLLPINTLDPLVREYFKEERIHKGYLYWDNQPVNQQLTLGLLTRISLVYGVSFEVARIRLMTLGLLIDDRYKSLRDMLKDMKFI